MLICFNGVDGSGKSYQAQRLVERLGDAGYPAVYVWGGGQSSLAMPLIRLGKRLLRGPRKHQLSKAASADVRAQYQAYVETTGRFLKNGFLRGTWRQIFLADHTLEIWRTIVPQLLRRRIVVCDRYIYDSVIRVAVMSGAAPEDLPRLLQLPPIYRVPRPDKWFLLDVPAGVAFQRKDDILDIGFLERRIPMYHAAAARLGMQVVDGTAAPEAIAEEVWRGVQPLLASGGTALRRGNANLRAE